MFCTLNSQGGFATATKVSLAAYNRYLLTEDLASSTIDAEQVNKNSHATCTLPPETQTTLKLCLHWLFLQRPHKHHCGHHGFQQLTRGMQSDDSQCIPEPVMYGIYRPVATSVSNTCMCS